MSVSSPITARRNGGPVRAPATAPLLALLALSILLGALFLHLGEEVREGDTLAADQSALRVVGQFDEFSSG